MEKGISKKDNTLYIDLYNAHTPLTERAWNRIQGLLNENGKLRQEIGELKSRLKSLPDGMYDGTD